MNKPFVKSLAILVLTIISAHAQWPELPTAVVDTAAPVQTGSIINVPPGASLQAAINAALPGDTIVLTSGATYTGNYTLPKKGGSGWVVITGNSNIPAPGTRATTALAGTLPILTSVSPYPIFKTLPGASNYRIVGLDMRIAPSAQSVTNIVYLENNVTSVADFPSQIIIDRCLIRGGPNVRRGVRLGGINQAVIDSSIYDITLPGYDTQAISGSMGPGPYKVANNYLEAASENIAFGGSDPQLPGVVPSDIVIVNNHMFKPLAWKERPGLLIKNSIEFKAGRRVLVEGNVFENNWAAAQAGYMIVLTPYTWKISDITIRNNIFRNSTLAVNISGPSDMIKGPDGVWVSAGKEPGECQRIVFANNLFDEITGVNGRLIQIINGPSDIQFNRNTIIAPGFESRVGSMLFMGTIPTMRFSFTGNIAPWGRYGAEFPLGTSWTTNFLPSATVASRFSSNVFVGSATSVPGVNTFVASREEAITFEAAGVSMEALSSAVAMAVGRGEIRATPKQ